MNKLERMKEIAKASPDFGKGVGYAMCVVDELHDMNELVRENDKLKEEIKKIKQRFEPQAFTDLLNEVENEYNLQKENERLKQIILGNEEEISKLTKDKDYFSDALDKQIEATLKLQKENEELKNQVRGYLINFADTDLMKVLKDCIIQNKKLSSQEQNQLSAWVECAMDFGNNLDECLTKLDEAKEIIRLLLWDLRNKSYEPIKDLERAEEFLGKE